MKLKTLLQFIDSVSDTAGKWASWLLPACLAVVLYDVLARYLFNSATIWAYDMAIFFYAGNCMLAGCYVQRLRSHIRVDVLFNMLSPRGKAILECCFYVVITLPYMVALFYAGIIFAVDSWMSLENSMYTVWHPPVYPIKTVIPIAVSLLLLQAIAADPAARSRVGFKPAGGIRTVADAEAILVDVPEGMVNQVDLNALGWRVYAEDEL